MIVAETPPKTFLKKMHDFFVTDALVCVLLNFLGMLKAIFDVEHAILGFNRFFSFLLNDSFTRAILVAVVKPDYFALLR